MAVAVACALATVCSVAAQAGPLLSGALPEQRAALAEQADALLAPDGTAAVFIRLAGTPASQIYGRALTRGGSGPLAESSAAMAAQAQVSALQAQHATFAAALARSGLAKQEIFRTTRVMNGFAVRMRPADMAAARRLPGVAAVEFLPLYQPADSTSVPFVGAPRLWEGTPLNIAGARGENVRIGIIDSGIDYQHPGFGGSGALADYQANDRTTITDSLNGTPLFPTAKVVGGWDFVGDAYTGANAPAADADPMDCGGHGSHVAGSAAGVGVRADGTPFVGPWTSAFDYGSLRIGPGVAPAASLYALRVFGCGGSTGVVVQALEWAQDPNDDGDFSDRLDVVNLSLGSNFGLADSVTAEAADNAAETGMIVVASAGNANDTFFISGSPGSGRRVIATANSVDVGVSGPVQVNAPAAVAGIKTAGAGAFAPPPPLAGLTGDLVAVDDGSTAGTGGTLADGCQTPFVNAAAVNGKVAFIDRGGCGFKLKAYNAQLNGALGVVIGNVASSGAPGTAPGMADDATVPAVLVPVASVALADADALRGALPGGGVNVTLKTGADTLSSDSSRGPGGLPGKHYIKPDVAAPGSNITSVQTGVTCTTAAGGCITVNASGYIAQGTPLTISGTSMASPHVAGYAALLRQMNPGSSVSDIKALILNGAAHNVHLAPDNQLAPFGASRIGAGRIDAGRVPSPILAFDDAQPELVGLAFNAAVAPDEDADQTLLVRLQNRTSIVQKVDLALDTLIDSPGVSFALSGATAQLSIPPSGSITVPVRMTASANAMKRFRDPTMAATQAQANPANVAALGALPRHYMAEESALLRVSRSGSEVARVPVYMAHRPHSDVLAPASNPTGSTANGSVALTLGGTGLCTGTVTGQRCTGNFAQEQSALLSGFELQYSAASNPALLPFADLQYIGVNHDAANDFFVFALATHGSWNSPNQVAFNICVDGNEDGSYDKVLFNTSLGGIARVLSTANGIYPQDVFTRGIFNRTENTLSFGGALAYINGVSGVDMDSALLDNNVLAIPATAAQLGLADGDRSFRYAVATCPGFNPFCVRLADPAQCTAAGALATIPGVFRYDAANKGITLTGGVSNSPLLSTLQPGGTLDVGYNEANMTANGSSGLLLLHHLNRPGHTAQVVTLDRLFADSLED